MGTIFVISVLAPATNGYRCQNDDAAPIAIHERKNQDEHERNIGTVYRVSKRYTQSLNGNNAKIPKLLRFIHFELGSEKSCQSVGKQEGETELEKEYRGQELHHLTGTDVNRCHAVIDRIDQKDQYATTLQRNEQTQSGRYGREKHRAKENQQQPRHILKMQRDEEHGYLIPYFLERRENAIPLKEQENGLNRENDNPKPRRDPRKSLLMLA